MCFCLFVPTYNVNGKFITIVTGKTIKLSTIIFFSYGVILESITSRRDCFMTFWFWPKVIWRRIPYFVSGLYLSWKFLLQTNIAYDPMVFHDLDPSSFMQVQGLCQTYYIFLAGVSFVILPTVHLVCETES